MPKSTKFDSKKIESKWQRLWDQDSIYSPDIRRAKKPFYNLMMFPYPSAEGLHVGNMYAFTGADICGRFNRMIDKDVFEPIGLDGFGLHSENFAIKIGRHPKEHAKISEEHFYKQLLSIGNGFSWKHKLETYDPVYYRWTQWIFLKMFRAGFVYKGPAMVNWCPSCKTVLADEQVIEGACERCETKVERREMNSWFLKITDYADRLLDGMSKINWPEKIKTAQRQWIGRSKGLEIRFTVHGSRFTVPVWTKYWETVFGATFIVVAPEYAKENLLDVVPKEKRNKVEDYIKVSLSKSEQERKENKEKTGVEAGITVLNPANSKEIPVYLADYVIMDVGSGAVMGVPSHDSRDFDFAKKYHLDIVQVVSYEDKKIDQKVKMGLVSHEGEGSLVNSRQFTGMSAWGEGKKKMAEWMVKEGFASWKTHYHLRDWGISRQRYWGPPIPLIYCESCAGEGRGEKEGLSGWYSVPEKDLPVILPDIKDFKPKGDGTSPLSNAQSSWKFVKCPGCGKIAQRELEVSDNFLDSSWYFLAYPHIEDGKWVRGNPFDNSLLKKWFPVDAYIGGAEHAVLHLLYSRFVWKVLFDLKYLPSELGEEPFPFLFGHGLLIKDGAKMSKSKGNVIVPDDYIKKFGTDTLRTYLMFLGPYHQGGDFRDTGIKGMSRFINRVWRFYTDYSDVVLVKEEDSRELLVKMHQTIKKVTEDVQQFKYNTAISAIMKFVNLLYEKAQADKGIRTSFAKASSVKCAEWDQALQVLLKLLAPFAPHITEEIWVEVLAGKFSIHKSSWPKYDPELAKEIDIDIVVQVNGKLRSSFKYQIQDTRYKAKVEAVARNDPRVAKWLQGKKIEKIVFVPGKLINFVTD